MSIEKKIAHIAMLAGSDLDRAWQEAFGEAAPALSPSLTRRALAHALQEQVHGALPVATRRAIERRAGNLNQGGIPFGADL